MIIAELIFIFFVEKICIFKKFGVKFIYHTCLLDTIFEEYDTLLHLIFVAILILATCIALSGDKIRPL